MTTKYVATKWDSAEDKAKFCEWLKKFLLAGCPRGKLQKTKYGRLCGMFGFIAHYNVHGFWDARFGSDEAILETLEQMRDWSMGGDPAWTWSDVEKEIQAFIRTEGLCQKAFEKMGCIK